MGHIRRAWRSRNSRRILDRSMPVPPPIAPARIGPSRTDQAALAERYVPTRPGDRARRPEADHLAVRSRPSRTRISPGLNQGRTGRIEHRIVGAVTCPVHITRVEQKPCRSSGAFALSIRSCDSQADPTPIDDLAAGGGSNRTLGAPTRLPKSEAAECGRLSPTGRRRRCRPSPASYRRTRRDDRAAALRCPRWPGLGIRRPGGKGSGCGSGVMDPACHGVL